MGRPVLEHLFLPAIVLGLALTITGVYIIATHPVRLVTDMDHIAIPHYGFGVDIVDDYTLVKTVSHLSIRSSTSEPMVVWRHPQNSTCLELNDVHVYFQARTVVGENRSLRLALDLCSDETRCERVLLDDLLNHSEQTGSLLVGKVSYTLPRNISDYPIQSISVSPENVVVEEMDVMGSAVCQVNLSEPMPMLTVRDQWVRVERVRVPVGIDSSGLQTGLALSLAGLMLIAVASLLRTR